jgi:hypothetical protein
MILLISGLSLCLIVAARQALRYEKALFKIRCYSGDEPDAQKQADLAYKALHWRRCWISRNFLLSRRIVSHP